MSAPTPLRFLASALFCAAFLPLYARAQDTVPAADDAKHQQIQTQIDALQKEADALDASIRQTQDQARTLQREVKLLDDEVKRHLLEIRRLSLTVSQTELDIQTKISGIDELTARIDKIRGELAKNIELLHGYDQENLLMVLIKHQSISDYFTALDNIRQVQSRVEDLVGQLKSAKTELEQEKAELEDYREQLLNLKALQEIEQRAAQEKRVEKNRLLQLTKGREAEFQKLLLAKRQDIALLKTQLFYLEKTGITAENALKYANLAAARADIRPAFLLALLEVETGKQFENGVITAGSYIGTGNWRNDLYNCYIKLGRRGSAEAEKAAFFQITAKLNLDPDQMPVSRRPSYGCGGAMGPAQFLPTTWLRFESRVAELTGHNSPSPWNIEDAFTAAAIFLSDAGADSKTRSGELQAARVYISGKPNCPTGYAARYACQAYANRVLALSQDIEQAI